jgi:hypothetical protein
VEEFLEHGATLKLILNIVRACRKANNLLHKDKVHSGILSSNANIQASTNIL